MTLLDPVWRRAPGGWRRWPWWSVAIALAIAVFELAGVTAPLASDAAADRSFAAEATLAADAGPGRGLDARATTLGLADADVLDAVTDTLDAVEIYDAPVRTTMTFDPFENPATSPLPVVNGPDGLDAIGLVLGRDGLIGRLVAARGSPAPADAGDGVWLPDTVAADIGATAGDTISVQLQYPLGDHRQDGAAPIQRTVAGVYRTTGDRPVLTGTDDGWSPPLDPIDNEGRIALVLTSASDALALTKAISGTALTTWDMAWTGPVSLERGRRAAPSLQQATSLLTDSTSILGRRIDAATTQSISLSSGIARFVDDSQRAAAALEPLIRSIAFSALVIAGAIALIAVWLLTRSRRRELELAITEGSGPLALAARATLELVVPMAVGVIGGYAVVRFAPGAVAGRGRLDRNTLAAARRTLLRRSPFVPVGVALAAFAAVWPIDTASASRARRVAQAVNLPMALVVATAVTAAQLVTQSGPALQSGSSLLFPLFTVLTVSVIAARLVVAAVRLVSRRHGWSTPPRSITRWLAVRRIRAGAVGLGTLLTLSATGVGLFAYSTAVASSGQRGLDDKAAAAGGANSTLAIANTSALHLSSFGLPDQLPTGATVVWRATFLHVGSSLATDLLVVDPPTFSEAVEWRNSFAPGRSLDEVLDPIATARGATLPVVLAGDSSIDAFPDDGRLDTSTGFVPYHVVGRIDVAPWQRVRAPMMITIASVAARRLPARLALAQDAADHARPYDDLHPPTAAAILDASFRTFLWSSGDGAALDDIAGTTAVDDETANVQAATRRPDFVAFSLSLPFLRLVGLALLLVTVVATMVLGVRQAEALAVELAIADLMAIPRRAVVVAAVAAASFFAAVGGLVGLGAAWWLAHFMVHRLDPDPVSLPGFDGRFAGAANWVAVGAVVLVAAAAAILEVALARRRPPAEVLRAAP